MEKKEMTLSFKRLGDEEGSVIVVALFILVILILIGISATKTTEIEIQIAGNQKFHDIAFYHADSGVYSTPKLISACLDNGAEQDAAEITYLGSSGTFYREIMGFDLYDSDRDVRLTLGGFNVDVDVNRIGQETLPGGGAEFGSGAEGIGVGSAGGVAILYDVDSLGQGPGSSQSNVAVVYRKIMGVAGGL